jgi:hypothetical protein
MVSTLDNDRCVEVDTKSIIENNQAFIETLNYYLHRDKEKFIAENLLADCLATKELTTECIRDQVKIKIQGLIMSDEYYRDFSGKDWLEQQIVIASDKYQAYLNEYEIEKFLDHQQSVIFTSCLKTININDSAKIDIKKCKASMLKELNLTVIDDYIFELIISSSEIAKMIKQWGVLANEYKSNIRECRDNRKCKQNYISKLLNNHFKGSKLDLDEMERILLDIK